MHLTAFYPLRDIIAASNPKLIAKAKHTDLSWNSDYSLLALGLEDG